MDKIRPYAKAIIAAIIAGLSALSTLLVAGKSFGDVTAGEWITVAIAFLVALSAVFAVPNSQPGG